MTSAEKVVLAEARVALARQRLHGTVETIQSQLAPEKIARKALDGVTDQSTRAARASVETIRRNPAVVAGAVALIGAVLARKSIAGLFTRKKKPVRIRRAIPTITRTVRNAIPAPAERILQ
jgi:hypothetical protein